MEEGEGFKSGRRKGERKQDGTGIEGGEEREGKGLGERDERAGRGRRGERKVNGGEKTHRRTQDDVRTNLRNFTFNAKLTPYEESWDLKV